MAKCSIAPFLLAMRYYIGLTG